MYNRYREEEKEQKELNKETETSADKTDPPRETDHKDGEVITPEEIDYEEDGESTEKTDEVEKLTAEVKKWHELYMRTLADAENFKKRINEERIRERKYGGQRIFEKMITVLDVFEQALNVEVEDQKLKNFLTGFIMINKQLKEILADEGVKKIEALNTPFDPLYHHAMEVSYDKEKDENIVLEVYQNGYTYKDRVLRPALVKVNKRNKKEENINNE